MAAKGMNMTQYAKHRRCSVEAVRVALKYGRISTRPDGRIDPVRADRDWEATTNPRKAKGRAPRPRAGARHRTSGPARGADPDLPSRAECEQRLAFYKSELAKIESEETAGRLVKLEDVERDAFEEGRRVRDRLLALPDRVGPMIAGISDIPLAIKTLRDEILIVLRELSAPIQNGKADAAPRA